MFRDNPPPEVDHWDDYTLGSILIAKRKAKGSEL
jgi:hypothetical protein